MAGMPQFLSTENVFIPGDEIVVVFRTVRMRQVGYADPKFTE
ncbi:hypothetical protein ACWCHM_23010 [Micromonospora sp. SCSIO 07396]